MEGMSANNTNLYNSFSFHRSPGQCTIIKWQTLLHSLPASLICHTSKEDGAIEYHLLLDMNVHLEM